MLDTLSLYPACIGRQNDVTAFTAEGCRLNSAKGDDFRVMTAKCRELWAGSRSRYSWPMPWVVGARFWWLVLGGGGQVVCSSFRAGCEIGARGVWLNSCSSLHASLLPK